MKGKTKMFKIDNENFDIEYAFLEAYESSAGARRLIFDLEIGAKRKDFLFHSHEIHLDFDIRLEIEKLLAIYPDQIKKWTDIAGKIITWREPEWDEPESDYPEKALLYVLDHEKVYDGRAELKNVNDKLFIHIKAFVDIFVGDKCYKRTPLEIETELHFNGILCGVKPSEEDIAILGISGAWEDRYIEKAKPYFNVDDFEFIENINGASIMMPGRMQERFYDRAKNGRYD